MLVAPPASIIVLLVLAARVEGARRPKERWWQSEEERRMDDDDGSAFLPVLVLVLALLVAILFVRHISTKDAHSIGDNFKSREEVAAALRKQGLEGCELVIGVDFTKSNMVFLSLSPPFNDDEAFTFPLLSLLEMI